MATCNNFFAKLAERVSGAYVDGRAITAAFVGDYRTGQLLRIHGAYRSSWDDFVEGDCYRVVSFADGVLTLDRPLYTAAPYLLIVLCEPTSEFLDLCQSIEEYDDKSKSRKGLGSESIDSYSWSAPSSGTGFGSVFAGRLKPYRCDRPTPLYYARNAEQWR